MARSASRRLRGLSRARKDAALESIARELVLATAAISESNQLDIQAAQAAGLSPAMIDRLEMGPSAVEATAAQVRAVMALPDPVGSRREMQRLQNGLLVGRERIPLGVVAMIYESRPNVTIDAASLCLKSGNACLLRGGKEAYHTNLALGVVLERALTAVGLPKSAAQIVPATDRAGIGELLSLTGLIDLAIPRGGEGLIRYVHEVARVPTVEHFKGVCHLYVDSDADINLALRLVENGKLQRPGVCNALECVLVHRDIAEEFLPRLMTLPGLELRACARSLLMLPQANPATPDDWGREYLAPVLAVRMVDDLDAALNHVGDYGSNHTEAICTRDYERAERWVREVDASCVVVNASTRFNDGGQLGLGAEIGISTSKLHAYGPMGLESLTTEKWVVLGTGQVRS